VVTQNKKTMTKWYAMNCARHFRPDLPRRALVVTQIKKTIRKWYAMNCVRRFRKDLHQRALVVTQIKGEQYQNGMKRIVLCWFAQMHGGSNEDCRSRKNGQNAVGFTGMGKMQSVSPVGFMRT
jgi:hypothetical protein